MANLAPPTPADQGTYHVVVDGVQVPLAKFLAFCADPHAVGYSELLRSPAWSGLRAATEVARMLP